jgi:hypothetical protein
MTELYPSSPIILFDVPEVEKCSAQFQYNFFAKDESLAAGKPVRGLAPRQINISFEPISISEKPDSNMPVTAKHDLVKTISGHSLSADVNVSSVIDEIDVAGAGFSAYSTNVFETFDEVAELVSGSLLMRGIDAGSPTDKAKRIDALTPSYVSGDILINAMGQRSSPKLLTNIYSQFNDKFFENVLEAASNDPFTINSLKNSSELINARLAQTSARLNNNSIIASSTDYSKTMQFINTIVVGDNADNDISSSTSIVGYIIDKRTIDEGKIIRDEKIVLERQSISSYVDTDVIYGMKYEYTIKTVLLLRINAIDNELGKRALTTILIASRPSKMMYVDAVDDKQPEEPIDFNIRWNFETSQPVLGWNFPIDRRQNIKRFQVLRRKSIHEPFELIRQFSFDDSDVEYTQLELVSDSKNIELTTPLMMYTDRTFSDSMIYAICSIDAHGLTSNYSTQLEIKFDGSKNKLSKKIISPAGAPKSYPNFLVTEESPAFIDVLKDSGHKKMRLFFDPEYLTVTDDNDIDVNTISTNKTAGNYKFQFINIDSQANEVIDVFINDIRDI